MNALRAQAAELLDRLTLERIQAEINNAIVTAVNVRAALDASGIARALLPSIQATGERVSAVASASTKEQITQRATGIRSELAAALDTDEWASAFPGRPMIVRSQ